MKLKQKKKNKSKQKKPKYSILQLRMHSFLSHFLLCSSKIHGVWFACELCTPHSGACKMRLVDPVGVGVGVWNKARIAIKEKSCSV
jgi:hypothetical protein